MVHFPKKIMGQFFIRKKPNFGGGGVEGGLANHHTFSIFFVKPSLSDTDAVQRL